MAGKAIQRCPGRLPIFCFPVGPRGQAWDPELDTRQLLCSAQALHSRKGHPGSFPACRRGVNHGDICHLCTQQAPRKAEPVEPATDNEDVEDRRSMLACRWRHPGTVVVAQQINLMTDPVLKPCEPLRVVVHFDVHVPYPARTMLLARPRPTGAANCRRAPP